MPLFQATATIFTLHEKELERSLGQFQVLEMMAAMREFLRACIPRIPVRTGFLKSAFKPMRNFFQRDSGADYTVLSALFGLLGEEESKASFERFQTRTFKDPGKDQHGKPKPLIFGPKLRPDQIKARERAYERELRKSLRSFRKNKANKNARNLRLTEYYYYAPHARVEKNLPNALNFVTPKDPADVLQTVGYLSQLKFDINISYYRINDFYSRISGAPWRSLDAGFQASLNYLETAAQRFPLITELLLTQRIYLRGERVTKETVGENNQVADYRGKAASPFYSGSGNIRGAKMDNYPGSATKESLPNMPAPTSKIATQRHQLLSRRKKKK